MPCKYSLKLLIQLIEEKYHTAVNFRGKRILVLDYYNVLLSEYIMQYTAICSAILIAIIAFCEGRNFDKRCDDGMYYDRGQITCYPCELICSGEKFKHKCEQKCPGIIIQISNIVVNMSVSIKFICLTTNSILQCIYHTQ